MCTKYAAYYFKSSKFQKAEIDADSLKVAASIIFISCVSFYAEFLESLALFGFQNGQWYVLDILEVIGKKQPSDTQKE